MRYLLLIHTNEREWSELPEREAEKIYLEFRQLRADLRKSGHLLGADRLEPTSTATSVRVRNGKPFVTDGPFAETREQLGGYFMIEAKDLDEAVTIAARIPAARVGTVEVRPIMEIPALAEG